MSRLARELVAILDQPTRFDAARYNENDLRREGLTYCAVDGTALLYTVLDSPTGTGRTIMILACGATNDGQPRLATIVEAQERLKRHQSTRSRS